MHTLSVSAIFGCRNSVPGFLGILSSAAGVNNCGEGPIDPRASSLIILRPFFCSEQVKN
jgi:hypothetical protein